MYNMKRKLFLSLYIILTIISITSSNYITEVTLLLAISFYLLNNLIICYLKLYKYSNLIVYQDLIEVGILYQVI
jgi:hypothetical protein